MAEPILAEHIAQQLRRDILRGKLPPGASIKERDSAAGLGVSRTPMREAIRVLANEGLVQLRPSRSPIVAVLNPKDATDQAKVLIALEKLSAELACTEATEADLARIAGIGGFLAGHFADADPLDMFETDMAFHTAIAEASHNPALAETHRTFLRRLWRARYLAARQRRNRERAVSEHTRIFDALKARDPVAAREAIHNHLWHLAEDMRGVLEAECRSDEGIPPTEPGDSP